MRAFLRWVARSPDRTLRCVACGSARTKGLPFLSGPGIYLCRLCSARIASDFEKAPPDPSLSVRCSFCGNMTSALALDPVRRHNICASCGTLAEEIFTDAEGRPAGA
jgi:hypothetical protein